MDWIWKHWKSSRGNNMVILGFGEIFHRGDSGILNIAFANINSYGDNFFNNGLHNAYFRDSEKANVFRSGSWLDFHHLCHTIFRRNPTVFNWHFRKILRKDLSWIKKQADLHYWRNKHWLKWNKKKNLPYTYFWCFNNDSKYFSLILFNIISFLLVLSSLIHFWIRLKTFFLLYIIF